MINFISRKKFIEDEKVLREIEKEMKKFKIEDEKLKQITKKLETEYYIKKARHENLRNGKSVRGDDGKLYKLAIR